VRVEHDGEFLPRASDRLLRREHCRRSDHQAPGRPKGIRLIVRQERSDPGAQPRFTDIGGHRVTFVATSTKGGQFSLVLVQAAHQPRRPCRSAKLTPFDPTTTLPLFSW
jgi:hypothetical protein